MSHVVIEAVVILCSVPSKVRMTKSALGFMKSKAHTRRLFAKSHWTLPGVLGLLVDIRHSRDDLVARRPLQHVAV
jgi:hypothetical protein